MLNPTTASRLAAAQEAEVRRLIRLQRLRTEAAAFAALRRSRVPSRVPRRWRKRYL
jgi:hypothetical protein